MRKREANNTMDDIRQFKQIQTYYVLPKIFLFSQFHATGFPLKNSLLPPVFPRTSPPPVTLLLCQIPCLIAKLVCEKIINPNYWFL